jgi:hypothetical protein
VPAQSQPEAPPNVWGPLLAAGLKLVATLSAAPSGKGRGSAGPVGSLLQTDAKTGRSYLKIPVPEPHVMQQLQLALSRLLADLGKQ